MRTLLNTIFALLIIFPDLATNAQEKGTLIDSRDGKTYETITYEINLSQGSFSDLDEYLTYETKKESQFEVVFQNRIPGRITWMSQNLNFESDSSKCAYDSDVDCELYGREYTWNIATQVCPAGWHLPSDNEWFLLAQLYGGVEQAGEHLKNERLSGTNLSKFNVIKPSIFWSSDALNEKYAWDWKVNYRWKKLQRWKGGKDLYNLVRCVKDY